MGRGEVKSISNVLVFSLILIFSLSLVSAGFLDWFKTIITGNPIDGGETCTDYDEGINFYVSSYVNKNGQNFQDICQGSTAKDFHCPGAIIIEQNTPIGTGAVISGNVVAPPENPDSPPTEPNPTCLADDPTCGITNPPEADYRDCSTYYSPPRECVSGGICGCTQGAQGACVTGLSGICGTGKQTCSNNKWGQCLPQTSKETCNGVDDDCDGTIDEDTCTVEGETCQNTAGVVDRGTWECMPTSPPPPPPSACIDQDTDKYSQQINPQSECSNLCSGETCLGGNDCNDTPISGFGIHPGATEICNGVDDNCDGAVDEGCGCRNGEMLSCTDSWSGGCPTGDQTCSNNEWGPCIQDTGYYDGDTNCNGIQDPNEDCPYCPGSGDPECPDGDCDCINNDGDSYNQAAAGCGITDCNDNNSDINPGATEICNGVDDNCVGGIDEGLIEICGETSEGACNQAEKQCMDGIWQTCESIPGYVAPTETDICGDKIDNDCDGTKDEGCSGCTEGETEVCGTGCSAGTQACEGGIWSEECIPYDLLACDDQANVEDCGGMTLETCGSNIGECLIGIRYCGTDGKWGACEGSINPTAEVCDDEKDNNCDGEIDENCGEASNIQSKSTDTTGTSVIDQNIKSESKKSFWERLINFFLAIFKVGNLIISGKITDTAEIYCSDPDGGINYFVKGMGTGEKDGQEVWFQDTCYTTSIANKQDECSDSECYLGEYFCNKDKKTFSLELNVSCKYGCVNGACVPEEEKAGDECTPYFDSKLFDWVNPC